MYHRTEWDKEDKILVARLIQKKRYKEAEQYVSDLAMVASTEHFRQYLFGVAFVLGMLGST